jgi:hypothetical protein
MALIMPAPAAGSQRAGRGRLVVSEATVKSHINHLLTKIQARDTAQAVRYAYANGLAAPPAGPPSG